MSAPSWEQQAAGTVLSGVAVGVAVGVGVGHDAQLLPFQEL